MAKSLEMNINLFIESSFTLFSNCKYQCTVSFALFCEIYAARQCDLISVDVTNHDSASLRAQQCDLVPANITSHDSASLRAQQCDLVSVDATSPVSASLRTWQCGLTQSTQSALSLPVSRPGSVIWIQSTRPVLPPPVFWLTVSH